MLRKLLCKYIIDYTNLNLDFLLIYAFLVWIRSTARQPEVRLGRISPPGSFLTYISSLSKIKWKNLCIYKNSLPHAVYNVCAIKYNAITYTYIRNHLWLYIMYLGTTQNRKL